MNGYAQQQINLYLFAQVQGLLEQRLRTVTLHREQGIGKVKRICQTNTAMAEGAHFATKQVLGGCVVKINIMPVGEHELHQPQSIARTGRLAHAKGESLLVKTVEIKPLTLHHIAKIIAQLKILNRRRILLQHWQIFTDYDRARHIPTRVDDHIFHCVGKFGTAPIIIHSADHRIGFKGHLAEIDNLRLEICQIHRDMPRAQELVKPTLPLQCHQN